MKDFIISTALFITFSLSFNAGFSQNKWLTYYEKSDFLETPRYDETIQYSKKLADASPWLEYQTFGKSPQGRDLPLLVFDKNGNFTPENVNKQDKPNLILLI